MFGKWPREGPLLFSGPHDSPEVRDGRAYRSRAIMGLFSKLLGKDKRPGTLVHEAFGGLIRVYGVPSGTDWTASEDVREGEGFVVHVLKYKRDLEPIPLTLSAKVYSLHEDADPPEDPDATDWRSLFGGLFAEVPDIQLSRAEQRMMTMILPASEAMITGAEGESGSALRIRERRSTSGQQQFIVTASGTAEVFDLESAVIQRWFDEAVFSVEG